jgi:AraC-like DNA-binding protein
MINKVPEEQKYDPWVTKQEITDVKVIVHCCRYWMLSEWECENMSFPFWRLYHSRLGGAYVCFEGKKVQLSSDKIVIIPPYTPFSTHLRTDQNRKEESIKGYRIKEEIEIDAYAKKRMTDQMFVHFNLGFPHDRIQQGIYEFNTDAFTETFIRSIEVSLLQEPTRLDFQTNAKIISLLLFFLQGIPKKLSTYFVVDERIKKVIDYIEKKISIPLTNKELAMVSNLATNSFARLFRENMNCSVQHYILQRRIDQAIVLMHHSNSQIGDIALECGFYDRHHFSRVFKKIKGIPPVSYRKKVARN